MKIEAILHAIARCERDLCEPADSRIIFGDLDRLRGRSCHVRATTLMPGHGHPMMANTARRDEALRKDLSQFMP